MIQGKIHLRGKRDMEGDTKEEGGVEIDVMQHPVSVFSIILFCGTMKLTVQHDKNSVGRKALGQMVYPNCYSGWNLPNFIVYSHIKYKYSSNLLLSKWKKIVVWK